jgi:predicted ATPase
MKLELRSVRLKNCGPIDDIQLNFFDASGKTLPVCVIGGANGSGKTTILEAIFFLAKYLGTSSYQSKERLLKPGTYIQVDWRFDSEDVKAVIGAHPEDVMPHQPMGTSAPPTVNAHSAQLAEIKRRIQVQSTQASPENLRHAFPSEFIPSVIYLPHSRGLEPVVGEQLNKEDDGYQFAHRIEPIRQFPRSLNSYLIYLDYAYPERYAAIQTFLNNLGFEGKTFRVDRRSFDVMVKTANGQEHRLHELSSGEQNLLIILIELYRKLTPGSIVLIDEIENSLHPAYQHRLAQGLLKLQKEIPYQLIVTTHARAFVEIFGTENTLLLNQF